MPNLMDDNNIWEKDMVVGIAASPPPFNTWDQVEAYKKRTELEEMIRRLKKEQYMASITQQNQAASPPSGVSGGAAQQDASPHVTVQIDSRKFVQSLLGSNNDFEVQVRVEDWHAARSYDDSRMIVVALRNNQTFEITRFEEPLSVFPSPELQTKVRLLKK